MEISFSKYCPKCGEIQIYLSQNGLNYAIEKNKICKSCIRIGVGLGKKLTEEHIKKLSDSHKGKQCGINSGMYGKRFLHTDETKKKISESSKGKIISVQQRLDQSNRMFGMDNPMRGKHMSDIIKSKLSILNSGKILSKETKKKCRIAKLKRKELLGIPMSMDKGAPELLSNINNAGFNFKPKRFIEIGYEADGYDDLRHIWLEYDTPYHNYTRQQKKDLVRENNIIQYFIKNGNPLKAFVRVKYDGTSKCIYKGKVL
jgi:hypothetical protein